MASDSEKRTQKDTLGDCVKTCSCSGFKTVNVSTNPENTYGIDDVSKHTDVNNVNLDVNCCNTFRLPMSGTDIDYAKVSEMFPAEPPSTDCGHDTTNTVDTPVDCTNTYNLATRGFVFSLLSSHDKCRNSHKEVIDELRKMISETSSSISAPDIYGDYPFFKIAADGTMLYMGKDDRVFRASEALETFSTKLDSAAALKDKWDIETHGKYYIGQKVSYNGRLYECTVINTDTEFNPLHWKELTLQEEIDDKRDKNDYRVYRRKKDIWRWSALKQEGYADTPDDFLDTANLINAPYPIFDDNVGEWTYEPQFWPNGKRKYFQQMPPVGDKFAYSINWVFSAYAEDGRTELFRFYATSVREETTDETLVYEDIQRIRIATTENVEKEVRKETIRAEAAEKSLSERVSGLEGNRDRWNAAATEIESTSANNRSVFTSVRTTSGDWNKTHYAVTASSDKWNSVYTSVSTTSGTWDGTSKAVATSSENWNKVYTKTSDRLWKSADNEIADKEYVQELIHTETANFRGNFTSWSMVPTTSAGYEVDVYGSKVPTKNDYLVLGDASDEYLDYFVAVDDALVGKTLAEDIVVGGAKIFDKLHIVVHDDIDILKDKGIAIVKVKRIGTWRFKFNGTWDETHGEQSKLLWVPEYQISQMSFDKTQLDAINSGITAEDVKQIGTNKSDLTNIAEASGKWNATHDAVTASSGNWNDVYTSVSSTSGGWDDATSLVEETSGSWNRYVSLTQLRPLLYEVTYDGYDWDIAREFFEKEYPVDAALSKPTFTYRPMACASVRKGNFHGRNLDWYYDWEPEFIVRVSRKDDDAGHIVRHSSYGFVSVIPGLTDGIAASKSGKIFGGDTEYNIYDIIPFLAVDGQNDTGLVVNANAAPAFERGRTTGNQNPSSDLKLCQTQIVRYILDNFSTAQEAADFFSKTGTSDGANVYGVYNDKIQTEMHFMVSDSSNTFVIEWIDNIPRVTEIPIMTNFHVSDIERDADGHVVVEEGKIEPHAIGIERFNLASDEMESVETMDDMAVLMRNLFYTRAYKSSPNPSNPYWYSEFVGETERFGDLTVFTPNEEFDKPGGIIEFADNSYLNRSRDNREPDNSTWHTTHSIVYDIANKKAIFITQEGEFGDSYIELTPNSTLPYSGFYLLDKTLRDYTNRKHAELSLMLARDAVSIAGVENTEFKNFRGIQELDRRSKRLVALKSNKSDFELIRGIPHADYVNSLFKIENTTLSGTILDVSAPSITAALTGKQNTLTTEQLSSIDEVPVLSVALSGKQNVLSTTQLSSIEAVPTISTSLSKKQDTLSTEQLSSISVVPSIASELSGKANKSDLMKYDPVTDEWYIEIEE